MSTFCSLPWDGLHINQELNVFPCCSSAHPTTTLGNLKHQSLQEILNGQKMTKMRQQFLDGKLPEECVASCGSIKGTIISKMTNAEQDNILTTKQTTYDKVRQLDLRAYNTCTLACSYCSPMWSSTIASRSMNIQESTKSHRANLLADVDLSAITELRMAGGEPLIIKDNLALLDSLFAVNKTCRILVDSGLSDINTPVFRKLMEFPNVSFIVSIDTTNKEQFEYIRYGAKLSDVKENIQFLVSKGISVSAHSVACLLSYNTFPTTLQELHNWGVGNVLIDPVFEDSLDIRHLPQPVIDQFMASLADANVSQLIINKIRHRLSEEFVVDKQQVLVKLKGLDKYQSMGSAQVFTTLFSDLFQ